MYKGNFNRKGRVLRGITTSDPDLNDFYREAVVVNNKIIYAEPLSQIASYEPGDTQEFEFARMESNLSKMIENTVLQIYR